MLLRFDPLRDIDRLASEILGSQRVPQPMPMDCYRQGDTFQLNLDMPGIDAGSLEVTVEDNMLTVRASRHADMPEDATCFVAERPFGSYARQLVVGDGVNLDKVVANYHDGVLTLTVPVAEQAKPRRVDIGHSPDSSTVTPITAQVAAGPNAARSGHLVGAASK